jgi:hypothetical protein
LNACWKSWRLVGAQKRVLAEHIAAHPEDAGRTVKDFNWIVMEIVTPPPGWGGDVNPWYEQRKADAKRAAEAGGPGHPSSAQQPAMPVIGFLHPASLEAYAERLRAFREGLKDAGFVEGEKWRSNIAGPTIKSIGCRGWQPNWFVGRSQ